MAPPFRVALILFLLILGGCVVNFTDGRVGGFAGHRALEARNRDRISTLKLGASLAEVRQELGEPDFAEAWLAGGAEIRVLSYRTHRTQADGETTRDETTALLFRAGRLNRIGASATLATSPA